VTVGGESPGSLLLLRHDFFFFFFPLCFRFRFVSVFVPPPAPRPPEVLSLPMMIICRLYPRSLIYIMIMCELFYGVATNNRSLAKDCEHNNISFSRTKSVDSDLEEFLVLSWSFFFQRRSSLVI
jgi:hypothetical protein